MLKNANINLKLSVVLAVCAFSGSYALNNNIVSIVSNTNKQTRYEISMSANAAIASSPLPFQQFVDLKAPASIYQGAADIGAMKASLSAWKIFVLGFLSGCHIGFGIHYESQVVNFKI